MRRPRLLPLLGALCLALPVLEILGIIWVGQHIGALWTLLLLIGGVVLGSWIIQTAGRRSLKAMASSLRRGQPDSEGLAQTGWIVVGGILFIVPGFITDVVGVLVMIPITRRLLGRAAGRFLPVKATWTPPATFGEGDQTEPTVVRGDVL